MDRYASVRKGERKRRRKRTTINPFILGTDRGADVREICGELVLFRVSDGLVIFSYL